MTEAALFLLLLATAWTDWFSRRVSNVLVIPFMLSGLFYQTVMERSLPALSGLSFAFLLTLLPVVLNGMGMGDQKLLMAVGAWTSYEEVYTIFLCSLGSCLLALLCSPGRWGKLVKKLHLLAVGWCGHRDLWLPDHADSALSLPYAVHLLFAYAFLFIWR